MRRMVVLWGGGGHQRVLTVALGNCPYTIITQFITSIMRMTEVNVK
jgi:hypothetical protein